MNKKLIIVFLAGWLLSLVLPPSRLLGMFRGGS
jgi:hypothetical protein